MSISSRTKTTSISTSNAKSVLTKKLLVTCTWATEILEPVEYLDRLYPRIVSTDPPAIALQDIL